MSAKPTISDTRFAVDGIDVDAANVAAPTGTQRNLGWTLNEVPTSAVANYLQNRAYRWFQYLSDGELTGDHVIDGNLDVSGDLAVGGVLAVNGSGTSTIDDDLQVGGDVAVTGTATAVRYIHGLRTMGVPLAPPGQSGVSVPVSVSTQAGLLNAVFVAPFQLPQGTRILRVRASVQDGASTLTVSLGISGSGGAANGGPGTASNGSGTVQTIQSPALTTTVAATNAYYVVIKTATNNSACLVFWAEVDYDAP